MQLSCCSAKALGLNANCEQSRSSLALMGAENEQSVTNWQALACDEDLPQNDSPLLFKGKEGSLGLTLSWKYGWGPPPYIVEAGPNPRSTKPLRKRPEPSIQGIWNLPKP